MSIKIYGRSDYLIEIEGDIDEEFTLQEENYFAFSNGCIIKVDYGHNGIWRISPIFIPKMAPNPYCKAFEAPENDDDNYSDIVEINGQIDWVVQGGWYYISKKK